MAATKGRARATWAQQRFLVVLGLPTLALALGATTISSYVPVLLRDFTGPMVSGALLATAGVFALFVPTIVGRMSDRTRSRLGGRLPFLLVATPVAALGLIAAPFANSLLLIALAIAVFYIAYLIYFTPYMTTRRRPPRRKVERGPKALVAAREG